MRIAPFELTTATAADREAWCTLALACRQADLPEFPEPTRASLLNRLKPYSAEEIQTWVACDGEQVIGSVTLVLLDGQNAHLGVVIADVHPAARRRGIGRTLMTIAVDEARQDGRTTLCSHSRAASAGDDFAATMGAQPVQDEIQSLLRLSELDSTAIRRWAAGTEATTEGFTLVRWKNRVPEELMAAYLQVRTGLDDMPTGDLQLRPMRRSAQEMRQIEANSEACDNRVYVIAAQEVGTGRLAGYTSMHVTPDYPWAEVGSTTILPAYRGRGFGLWVKAAMVCWLTDTEPQLAAYLTENASSNVHMRQINERLGYRVLGTWRTWQLSL